MKITVQYHSMVPGVHGTCVAEQPLAPPVDNVITGLEFQLDPSTYVTPRGSAG